MKTRKMLLTKAHLLDTCSTLARHLLAAATLLELIGLPVYADVPSSMDITCDVDRTSFRTAAARQIQVIFRLWDSETGGSQCGPDYIVPMTGLNVLKTKTDTFDSQIPRNFAEIRTAIGSDATPVQVCSGDETWLDVTVGFQTFTCDFGSLPP